MEKADLEEGRKLLADYHSAEQLWCCSPRDVPPPSQQRIALENWLWNHRYALVGALTELEGTRLQVESRDRTIIALLGTLSQTEERLPGITAAPKR